MHVVDRQPGLLLVRPTCGVRLGIAGGRSRGLRAARVRVGAEELLRMGVWRATSFVSSVSERGAIRDG